MINFARLTRRLDDYIFFEKCFLHDNYFLYFTCIFMYTHILWLKYVLRFFTWVATLAQVCHMCCIQTSNWAPRNVGESCRRSNICINDRLVCIIMVSSEKINNIWQMKNNISFSSFWIYLARPITSQYAAFSMFL